MNEKEMMVGDIKKLLKIAFRYRHAYVGLIITKKNLLDEYSDIDLTIWNEDMEILNNLVKKFRFNVKEFK